MGHISEQGQDVIFGYYETLAREEYNVVVQLERFGVACRVESTEAPGADKLLGEEDGKTEDLVKSGGYAGQGISGCFGESAKELLIDLRRGHQRCEDDITEFLGLRH